MGELIPLFPLGTPLFPGVVLPLQIFEPRYRRLMRDLMALPEADERRFFGVVAIRQGWEVEQVAPAAALYDIGCTAPQQRVVPPADGGLRVVTDAGASPPAAPPRPGPGGGVRGPPRPTCRPRASGSPRRRRPRRPPATPTGSSTPP